MGFARSYLVLVLLFMAMPAGAQERHGFWLNVGLGYGSLGCTDCTREGGLSGALSLGGALSSNLLLGVGSSGYYKDIDGSVVTLSTLDARLRVYPSTTSGFFLTTGVGVGNSRFDFDQFETISKYGPALILGLGYDIPLGGGSLKLTPYLEGFAVRVSNAFGSDHTTFNVGQVGLSLTILKTRSKPEPAAASVPEPPPVNRGYQPAQLPPPSRPASVAAPEPTRDPAVFPPGTAFIGDSRLKLYYAIECAEQKAVPEKFRVLFYSAAGAEQDGFKRSGDC